MLRSASVLGIRRRIARRADRILSKAGLVEPRPASSPVVAWAEVTPAPAPPASAGLDPAAVQAVLDEMVRPALQSDGGDIALVRVDGGDVYVSLVGACHSCPSAVLTMKMGVESLLAEELDGFERLIQVDRPQQAVS